MALTLVTRQRKTARLPWLDYIVNVEVVGSSPTGVAFSGAVAQW